jgi:large subunit ribosomal protein L20
MPRAKGGPRARKKHKKVVKEAKGFRGLRSKTFRRAQEAVIRKGEHAFHGRKQRRRDIRKLWIMRINAALKPFEIKYSRFISGLKKSNIKLNRKMLSEIAIHDPKTFEEVVNKVKENFSN